MSDQILPSPRTEQQTPAAEAEPDPAGRTPGVPTVIHDPATNHLSMNWNGERPDELIISADLLEQLITERNKVIDMIAAQQAVLQTCRLGRRPSVADWVSVGLADPGHVQIDLMARRDPA
jgi:hypothetical protein